MAKFIWGVQKTLSKDPSVKDRLEALTDIKFKYETPYVSGNFSSIMIFIGRKFYIAKTKDCKWLEQHLNKLLKAYNSNGMDSTDLYFPIVKQIHNTGHYEVHVRFICQSSNPYEVIKAEYMALIENVGTPLCLNKNKESYTPKWNEKTQTFGWLTKNQYLNYKKLVKSHS